MSVTEPITSGALPDDELAVVAEPPPVAAGLDVVAEPALVGDVDLLEELQAPTRSTAAVPNIVRVSRRLGVLLISTLPPCGFCRTL
jgi:hypothetical protein